MPVLPFEDMENLVPPEEYDVYLAVGYSKMNNNRICLLYTSRCV